MGYDVDMGVAYKSWSQITDRPTWVLAFILLLLSFGGYRFFVDSYGPSVREPECWAYRGVVVFADSNGFTDKRHVRVCVEN